MDCSVGETRVVQNGVSRMSYLKYWIVGQLVGLYYLPSRVIDWYARRKFRSVPQAVFWDGQRLLSVGRVRIPFLGTLYVIDVGPYQFVENPGALMNYGLEYIGEL